MGTFLGCSYLAGQPRGQAQSKVMSVFIFCIALAGSLWVCKSVQALTASVLTGLESILETHSPVSLLLLFTADNKWKLLDTHELSSGASSPMRNFFS